MHWFVDNFALYTGSVRGLFVSDFSAEYDAYIESSVINLRARGIEPFLTVGDQIVAQAEALWAMATSGTPFNQPHVTSFELDMLRAEVAIIKDLEAPVTPSQLWYLYHYIIYPRALFNKATVVTTSLGLDEFVAYGSECEDFEYAGRKLSWEKLMWLVEATMIDLYQFRQVKTDGHPPMLKAEYNLFNAMNERGLPVTAQQVLGDYMLDMSIADRDNRLAIEIDVLASLDPNVPGSGDAKKNLVLLSDGWKILRFTTAEILGDLTSCVDAVEQVWTAGRKKSAVGRLMSGREQPKIHELPVDDDSQKLAITHGAGPVAVTGGAGTGKTSTVAHRVAYLLAQGVCPERILVFSHSEETVAQLKRKVEILSDGQTVQRIGFSDWKDLGLRILKENAAAVKRKPPLKLEAAPHRVLQRVLKKELKDIDPLQLEMMDAEVDEATIGQLISLYKANLITPERIKERATTDAEDLVAKLFSAYEEALKKSNKVDPDDTISLCAQLLADDPEVRAKYQHKYEFVIVDEYQECTAAADLMARLLAFPQENLFLVGDEDECVTENKGAMPRYLADTSIRMPNARCYVLDKNWRSHPAIVDHSRSLAAALGFHGIVKDMFPGYGTAATSAVIGPQQCKSEEAEADWVANEVAILIESGKSLNDIVVLWRNQRYASLLEAALFKKNIKCVSATAGSESVPDEVGDVMAFLRLVMDPDGPKARASFERFCQLKSREMDQKLSRLSNTIASFAEANNLSFLKAIEIYHDATADSSCEDLAQLVRIVRTMNQEGLPPAQTIGLLKRTQKLNEIYAAVTVPPGVVYEPMRKVEQLEEEAKAYGTVREFVKAKQEFLENKDPSIDESCIQVKSFEDAKGCEYPIAFLTGMAEGLCPSDQAVNVEEERRLCYVAMTRAKELLYISYPATYEEKPVPPSPFLVEARLLPINVYRKAVSLIQHELPAKPNAQAEPAAPGSGMLTPIMTGRPERVRPGANRERNREGAPAASPGQQQPGQQPGGTVGSAPPPQSGARQQRAGNRPGSDVADLLGGRITSPGSAAPPGGSAQPIIRPAGHSANLARGAAGDGTTQNPSAPAQNQMPQTPAGQTTPGQQANPFVGFDADHSRVTDEARQRAENEARLKAQYEAHIVAQQQAAAQAELEAQKRAEQDAYLRMRHEQQMREQQEALIRAQQEESLKRAMEEAARKEQHEARMKAEHEAEIRKQQEAELQAQREAAILAQQEAEQRARQEAAQRAQDEAAAKAQHDAMLLLIQQEAERKAQEEAALLAQQQAEAQAQALREAELHAQRQAEEQAQREAALRAQQEAERLVREEAARQAQAQEAALQAQREAAAQQQAQFMAQQEAALRAQQQAALQAQQQADFGAVQQSAMTPQQQAEYQAQQEAALKAQRQAEFNARIEASLAAQQDAEYRAQQQEAALRAQQHQPVPQAADLDVLKAQQEAAARAQQEALARVQEKAAQRAMIDLELRMSQEAAMRSEQQASIPNPPSASPTDSNSDLTKLVDEQFNFAGVPISQIQPPASDSELKQEVEPDRSKQEEEVRSIKESLEELSPAERSKQQDALRKKAREKLSKGRKKKGGETDAVPPAEPISEVAPAAVSQEPVAAPGDVPVEPVLAAPSSEVSPEPTPAPPPREPFADPVATRPSLQPSLEPVSEPPETSVQSMPTPPLPETPEPSTLPAAASSAGLEESNPYSNAPNPYGPTPNPYGQSSLQAPAQQSGFQHPLDSFSSSRSQQPVPYGHQEEPPPAVAPPAVAPPAPEFKSQPYTPAPAQQVFEAAPQITPVMPRQSSLPFCPQCSNPLEPNARFCGECGLHLTVQPQVPAPVAVPAPAPVGISCPSCAEPLEPNARFCGECGHSLV